MMLRKVCRKYLRHRWRSVVVAVILLCAGWIVYAKSSGHAQGPFGLAGDFPRGPMVYAQFTDLPALIKQWDESDLKQQYLNSTNFKQFENRHLARKLVSRWREFNEALGFDLDTATVSESAENRVAMAVYDIGRLDLVFIAPLSEEKIAATKFFQSKDGFQETELPDGTVYYSREVEADHGRQKQELCFAMLNGRFVLATNEHLLLRTLANINGKSKKDRLSDEPSFTALSSTVKPHCATFWVDQTKLNSDWYFKHYWVMRNIDQLKAIRAGMFDLELQEGKWIEHRDFLYMGQEAARSSGIPAQDAKRIAALVPADAPYFKLHAVNRDPETAANLIRDTLFDRQPQKEAKDNEHWNWESYGDSDFYDQSEEKEWGTDSRYDYLGRDYNKLIDDPVDAKVKESEVLDDSQLRDETERRAASGLQQVLQSASPLYAAAAESPRTFDGPLFAEFRRLSILTLREPGRLDSRSLERAISGLAQSRLMIAGASANLRWTDGTEGSRQWRELELPMLGWTLCYAVRGQELIVANDTESLRAAINGKSGPSSAEVKLSSSIDDLTVIRLDQREQAFDRVMDKLDDEKVKAYWKNRPESDRANSGGASQEFFSGNISSLLDVTSRVRQIEIKRSSSPGRLHEEIEMVLK